MKTKSANSSSANDSPRCRHRFGNGTRCRLPVPDADTPFCPRHAKLPGNVRETEDIAAALTADLTEFTSVEPINDFLTRLLLLLAQDRISPRRAAVLAYITNQLLRTLSVIDREADAKSKHKLPATVIWDIPRPPHEHPVTTP